MDKDKDSSKKSDPVEEANKEVKIIQTENWYDFDVEIQQKVKKDFYAKRTIGQVFEDALQKYFARKGLIQVTTYKEA